MVVRKFGSLEGNKLEWFKKTIQKTFLILNAQIVKKQDPNMEDLPASR